MTTHLYCVLPHDLRAALPPGLSGLAGERVRTLMVDGLVAWVSDVARTLPVSVDGVRVHDAVVEAALDTGATPVPARFGQRFDSDDACREALRSRAASVESLLADVRGSVEMTLIITPSTRRMIRDLEPVLPEMVDEESEGPGRRYLDSLRKREAATGVVNAAIDELAQLLTRAAGSLVRRATVLERVAPLPLRTISHLIAREAVAEYKAAVGSIEAGGELRFLIIGPRAPYSFSALTDSGGRHGMNLAD
ncbi:MAG: GvpL/GvpF family gas vesicle protein [Gemmatimonadaceae bacterium]